MIEKGYPHPLYSLDLQPHGGVLEDEPRYGILLPEGRLVVRAELRRRAQDHSVLAVDHLAGTALAYAGRAPRELEGFGLGPAWQQSMRHWRARMLAEDEEQMALTAGREQAVAASRQLLGEGRAALSHLVLSARLAGLGDRVAAGAPPEAWAALHQALEVAAERSAAPMHAALLARNGFGPEAQTALRGLLRRMPLSFAAREAAERSLRAQGDAVLVLRAALLGDAARLCQVAPQVLGPERCRALKIAQLLGRRPRRTAGPPPPPA